MYIWYSLSKIVITWRWPLLAETYSYFLLLNTIINPYYHSCGFMTDIYLTITLFPKLRWGNIRIDWSGWSGVLCGNRAESYVCFVQSGLKQLCQIVRDTGLSTLRRGFRQLRCSTKKKDVPMEGSEAQIEAWQIVCSQTQLCHMRCI